MRDHPHIGATSRQYAGPQTSSANAERPVFSPRWPPRQRQRRPELISCPEVDCVRHLIGPGDIAAAELRAIEIGTGADRVLVAQGAISDERYARELAFSLGTGYDRLLNIPRQVCLASDLELIESAKTGILSIETGQQRVAVIAPRGVTGRQLVLLLRQNPDLRKNVWLTTSRHLFEFVSRHAGAALTRKAIAELRTARPEFSARLSRSDLTFLPVFVGLAAVIAFMAGPAVIALAIAIALALVFFGWTALRVASMVVPAFQWRRPNAIADSELPIYSIIIALYHEAATVEGLVEALKAFDYPQEKLDVIFVVEPDDPETRWALGKLKLGPAFMIITAPTGDPRTKPKALNAALPFARGSYVAVFDAEDRPDSDQLRKALQAFRDGGPKLACVQARLAIDNSDQNWLTGLFAAEYAGLFDVFLPGIATWRLPLPLGGSSNHFRTSILRAAGAWDPYNVTEDADLGMRLARFGFHTAMIDSTTCEEAPSRVVPWLLQRTRWFKGWMQTWLVHMRHPLRLWRDLGPSGFLVFHLIIGGALLTAMAHGVFAVALGWQVAMGWLWAEKSSTTEALFVAFHWATLIAGYAVSGALGLLGLARRRMMSCARSLWLMPLYWLLLSLAAWRALFDLILKPYTWDKTEHALTRHLAR